jgi:hypothetical protein
MKLYLSFLVLIAHGFLLSSANADNFSVQVGSPTITHSLELQKYVQTIASYQPETSALKKRLQKTLSYYKKIHILKTINKINYTIDCIPFAEQPALIDNPMLAETMLAAVRKTTKKNLNELKKMGEHFYFNPAKQCPLGSVAILRPSKVIITSKQANKKVAPGTGRKTYSRTNFRGGYSYQLGENNSGTLVSILTEANQAYFKGPQNQFVESNDLVDHSLDQFWFTNNTYEQSGATYSVEFGIIASAYFTNTASTSIFVFASIDNYGSDSCYNLECNNFHQLPNTPVLGDPTNTNIDYVFQVTHTTLSQYLNSPAYYLTLVTHDPSTNNATNSTSVLLGFYPDSIYIHGVNPLPRYFSAGSEVYAHEPNDGTQMYGNYMNPYIGYTAGPLQIQFSTENDISFPYYTSNGPSPYGLIWHLGQTM